MIDKVKFSDKRFGEDVQTLFFLTYLADKVRTSSYAGYVHIFREGSLLADAPEYFCFIHSTLAEIEIIDFLKEHNDKLVGDYMMNVLNQQIKIAKESRKHISNSEKRKYANEWKLIVDYEKLNRNTFK